MWGDFHCQRYRSAPWNLLATQADVLLFLGAVLGIVGTLAVFWSKGELKRHEDLRLSANEAETARANEAAARAAERASEADAHAAEAHQAAEQERLAPAKIEARIAPRALTQAQQNELTAALSEFTDQRGTVIASPRTPESEWFARVLSAPLAAEWKMNLLPGLLDRPYCGQPELGIQYAH
jgi:hypothetical protein